MSHQGGRSSHMEMFCKKLCWKIRQNLQRNTSAGISFEWVKRTATHYTLKKGLVPELLSGCSQFCKSIISGYFRTFTKNIGVGVIWYKRHSIDLRAKLLLAVILIPLKQISKMTMSRCKETVLISLVFVTLYFYLAIHQTHKER